MVSSVDGRPGTGRGAVVLALARGLRSEGVPVGVDRVTQALQALAAIRTDDREAVRSALAATLLTASAQRAVFDRLFDALLPDPAPPAADDRTFPGGDASGADRALLGGAVTDGAAESTPADREPGTAAVAPVAGGSHDDAGGSATGSGGIGGHRPARGATPAGRFAGIELLDLEDAPDEAQLYRAVRRLAELSAARPGRRSPRDGRGRVDLRATIRRSLSSGGMLMEPVLRRRRRDRPRLILLADVSGSMGQAARLALLVCHAFSRRFSSIRTYAFVNRMQDVTRILDRASADDAISAAVSAVVARGSGATSDYGAALASLWPDHVAGVRERTTVVVFGDARTNYRPPNAELLQELRRRADKVFWLNPEPRGYWGLGDSAADVYAPHCDGMLECRRLDQLVEVVTGLAETEVRQR